MIIRTTVFICEVCSEAVVVTDAPLLYDSEVVIPPSGWAYLSGTVCLQCSKCVSAVKDN